MKNFMEQQNSVQELQVSDNLEKVLLTTGLQSREICSKWFILADAGQLDHIVQGFITGLGHSEKEGLKLFASVSRLSGFEFRHIERDVTGNWWVVNDGRRKRVIFQWI